MSKGYHMAFDPGKQPLSYIKGGRFSLIVLAVILVHILLVVLPFFILKLSDLFNAPLAVEQVSLADTLPSGADIPAPRQIAAATPTVTGNTQINENDLFTLPDLPSPPDIPPEEKFVQEKEKSTEETVQEAPPEISSAKEAGKKNVKKTVEVKPKKRFTAPEDIRKSTKKVRRTRSSVNKNTNKKKSAQELRAERISALLQAYRKGNTSNVPPAGNRRDPYGRTGTAGSGSSSGGTKRVTEDEMLKYYESVRIFLMRSWQQPNTALLNKTRPEVQVLLHADASGRILSAKIIKKSGNNAMDRSVEAMLEKVKVLPKPPEEMTFTVNVNIE